MTGLHQVNIESAEDLLAALNLGSVIRQTDATAINARSSRSHAVFSLTLTQRKSKVETMMLKDKRISMPADAFTETVATESKLHFVDLAGSERLKHTQASGERAKEGISINAGLASLGKVISQLSSRNAGTHISYRDSKLTRLLQDSLGGNAITYLIACVTPAEFHLSETVNTVQYAQRARAIQTRPQIQQVEDGDKQAVINRLRAEIQFLRSQMTGAEQGGNMDLSKRKSNSAEMEARLQNQLFDLQENYANLSQRHVRLMSEMTKDHQGTPEDAALPGANSDNAIERIKRSASFADAVEQVVLEYEKTIQSLESSLSKTRSTLSASENSLLEKETRYAYVQTINQQLQSRIQKLIDRETNNEQYIHEIESRLDGAAGGEERQTVMLSELRKEVSRLRESENTSEDYIAGLEDKLAEAVNNTELLHREVNRLEDVLERQQSVGKMDTLLQDLDQGFVESNGIHPAEHSYNSSSQEVRTPPSDEEMLEEAITTPIPEDDSDGNFEATRSTKQRRNSQKLLALKTQTQAQSNFLQEKLEVVNQELFDLRVDHESTLSNYDLLSAKYEEALRTLAAFQEESRHGTSSGFPFLAHEGANDGQRDGKQSSSRSLSLELSSLGQSTEATEATEVGSTVHPAQSQRSPEVASREIGKAGNVDQDRMLSRHSAEYSALQQRYEALHDQHLDTLDLVEELKTEVSKIKHSHQNSGLNNNLIRRKSSQNLLSVDRAHRSLASLENIAADNFGDNPDIMDNFHLNLNTLTHELHQRTERVQELESDLSNTKKELDTKMTIISGLARERTSKAIATSPMEMSMLSAMQDQVNDLERQLVSSHETYGVREQDLLREISTLRKHLEEQDALEKPLDMPGALPITPMESPMHSGYHDPTRIVQLEAQVAHWQDKHNVIVESMQESERRLLSTIAELEQTTASLESNRKNKAMEVATLMNSTAAAAAAFELERERHEQIVQHLKNEIQARAGTIGAQASRLITLEKDLTRALMEIQQHNEIGASTIKSLDDHREHIQSLERQLAEHQSIINNHKDELTALQNDHEIQMEAHRASLLRGVEGDLSARHVEQTNALQKKIQDLELVIQSKDTEIERHKTKLNDGSSVIENLREQNKTHSRKASEAFDEAKETRTRLEMAEEAKEQAESNLNEAQNRLQELQWETQQLNKELETVREKEERSSRLVEELEGQLHSTFEHSRKATSRLSHLQVIRDQELIDARTTLVKAQDESALLRARLEQIEVGFHHIGLVYANCVQIGRGRGSPIVDSPNSERANSLTSQMRNLAVASLPSPPPTQPLPPIPTSPRESRQNGASSPNGQRISQQIPSLQYVEERDARLRTMEKHLKAEKQLTQTLEEALSDLETQVSKSKKELEAWRGKAWQYENELNTLRRERQANRQSLQQVEEAKIKQREAEIARQHLEERMAALNKKKKKGGLNCF